VTAMEAEEADNSLLPLQPRNIDIQIHAVDAFDFQGDVLGEHFGNAS